ncbi:MAG: hypothetical protein PHS80_00285 [Methanothrix sp.]|nr:hypothetical protein [Bacteroidales bacterium]MDD2753938.1 hypothetical protein [Methanothrix sp.]
MSINGDPNGCDFLDGFIEYAQLVGDNQCDLRDSNSPHIISSNTQKSKYTMVKSKLVRETEKAICVEYNRRNEWFPKSQIQSLSISDGIASFYCPNWLIDAKTNEAINANH